MRMIGIGLLGFLLAGVALFLSTMNIVERGQTMLFGQPQLNFEMRDAAEITSNHTATIKRSNPNQPIILSGLPAYQGVSFHLPLDARPTSGYLQIDVTTQVMDNVEGVLRISIDNVRRGEVLLHPGTGRRSVQISLSPMDFARDRLVVSFSLQGQGPGRTCTSDVGVEAIVEIETTSAIFLNLDRPLETSRDRIAAWGQLARVAWSPNLTPKQQMERVAVAAQYKLLGAEVVMVDTARQDAITPADLRKSLRNNQVPDVHQVASAGIAQSGSNAGLRQFAKATTWRVRHNFRDQNNAIMPTALELSLMLGTQFTDSSWSVIVTLNDRLIFERVIEKGTTDFAQRITLPSDMMALSNLIEVTATSTGQDTTGCADKGDLIAEMLPQTHLVFGEVSYADPLQDVLAAVNAKDSLSIASLNEIGALDANVASSLISQINGNVVNVEGSTDTADMIVVTPTSPVFGAPDIASMWLVMWDDAAGQLAIRTVNSGDDIKVKCPALLVLSQRINLAQLAL